MTLLAIGDLREMPYMCLVVLNTAGKLIFLSWGQMDCPLVLQQRVPDLHVSSKRKVV